MEQTHTNSVLHLALMFALQKYIRYGISFKNKFLFKKQ